MKTFPYKKVIKKYMIVSWLLVLISVMIVAKASYTMFAQREMWAEVAQNCVIDSVSIPVTRGDILSADGQLLATYVPEYKIFLDYNIYNPDSLSRVRQQHRKDSVFLSKVDSISTGLNHLFPDKTTEWFRQRLMEGFDKKSRHWLIYPRRISYLDYKEVKKIPYLRERATFSGFHTETFDKIDKPFGSLAGRTLGDVDRNTGLGISGLQKSCDSLLRGVPGLAHKVKTMNTFLPITDREPVAGANIHTTLDVNMQDFCESALLEKLKEIDGMYGVAILLEVETGDIKALVNMERGSDGVYRDVRNYACSQLMQPGSVFKTVSITAALEAGKVDLNTTVDCTSGVVNIGGHNIHDASHKSNKVISLREVLGYSSNVGVIKLITKGYGGSKQTEQQFCDDVMRLGIADDLELDIPGYQRARIPSPKSMGEYWSASSMGSMSIGYSTQVPPISLAAFYNGIANGGRLMRPRLVTRVTRNGVDIENIPPRAIRERMCSPQTVHDITECLKWVVSDGLGGKAGSPYFTVAGKTGTARVQEVGHMGEYLITFAGFFPADKPKYTCVVSMRKAGTGSGGGMCGPVFRQIAEYVMSQGNKRTIKDNIDSLHIIAPVVDLTNLQYANRALSALGYVVPGNWNPDKQTNPLGHVEVVDKHAKVTIKEMPDDVMPDLTGMGPRDALFLMEKRHLKVKLCGTGKVVAQSLPSGHKIKPDEQLVLTLGCGTARHPVPKKATPKPQPAAQPTPQPATQPTPQPDPTAPQSNEANDNQQANPTTPQP